MNYIPSASAIEVFSEQMAGQMKAITEGLGANVAAEQPTLADLEQAVLQALKTVGNGLLAGLCGLYVPKYVEPTTACGCGEAAVYQRLREGETQTVLGEVKLKRPYYLCSTCHQGRCPLDAALGFCAGGMSAGLQEVLALLGVQFPFEEAVQMLAQLTLVQVSPNTCRKASEEVGRLLLEQEQAAVAAAWDGQHPSLPPVSEAIQGDFYISMDGVTVHLAGEGWKNQWLGAVYTTQATTSAQRPDTLEVRTRQPSFYTDLTTVETFGRHLWLEAQRRGLAHARQVIVIGDGAHWIWKQAEEHFPTATQILDWYHASTYVWKAANAIFGENTDFAKHFAHQQLDLLWAGNVQAVLQRLEPYATQKPGVNDTLTYFRNNQSRMHYADYRAQGWQVGSGTIESGCKHVIAARLKQAGMLWSRHGARCVAKLRAGLKSGRWRQIMAQRPKPARTYHRKAA